MLRYRVIPVLLLHNNELVKTKKFKNPVYVGDPINAVKIFNEKEVDEIIILDITPGLCGNLNYSLIKELAEECFMPLCYGGGIRSLEDADRLFDLGIEKISLRSAIFENPHLIEILAAKYGSQSLVVSIDIKRNILRTPTLFRGKRDLNATKNWLSFIKRMENSGAGEILLNSVDRDGMFSGYDLELISLVSNYVNIPLIALGGASCLEDFKLAIDCGASAVAAGSFFVFSGEHRAVLITYPSSEIADKLFC